MLELTLTDLFCGAGGSSSGLMLVPGIIVRMAANHWRLAVNTHNLNHPQADHDCADLSQVDPRKYPRTNLLWISPECTNHSGAKGKRRDSDSQPSLFDGNKLDEEAAQRSRATMWDVLRFTEHHQYDAVMVENVVEASKWSLYPAWRHGFDNLGYCVHVVYMNSMHFQALGAPAPQSRDRGYHLAHKRGTRCPDLNKWLRPKAYCPGCDEIVNAMQAFKKPNAAWGRYRAQYVWRCPSVSCRNSVIEPWIMPAGSAIDWNLPGQRIGDRDKPLAAKTRHRIQAYFDKYPGAWNALPRTPWNQHLADGRPGYPPFMVELRGGSSKYRSLDEPMATVTAGGNHHGLVVPAGGTWNDTASPTTEPLRTLTTRDAYGLVVPYNRTGVTRSTDEVFGTFTTRDRYAMVMRNNTGGAEMVTPVSEELRTLTTAGHQSLLHGQIPNVDDCHFRMLEPHEIQAGMAFDSDYTILGNKKEKVRQLGNAVTPPASRDLGAAVAEALGYEIALAA